MTVAANAPRANPESAAAFEAPGFDLQHKGGRLYEVHLRGRFSPGWLGPFTAGLARHHLNILGGSARKISPSLWSASFELDASVAVADLAAIDFLALTAGRADAAPAAVRLESFQFGPTGEESLYVEIRAQDQLGFLNAVLKSFALFSLFPAELAVETRGSQVFDRFWLKGVGGSMPSAAAVGGLRSELEALAKR